MIILNMARISASVFDIWRELDSTEVLYTWNAMLERTDVTYKRGKEYSMFLRTMMALVLAQQMVDGDRLN